MLVSYNWLKELVPLDATPAEVDRMITMAGVEVDNVQEVKPDFSQVVVGHILKIFPHPNADKLVLCDVEVGKESPLRIVCGAANMKDGDKVPVALVGAVLKEGLKVKKAKIRGEASEGMMCSERELGLGDDHSGIMILPPETTIGSSFAEVMNLNDAVLELAVTPNRSDCLSIIGVARELAAITHAAARPPEIKMQETEPETASLTSITIEDDIGCPRYAARIVSGVKIGPSPLWMQQKLKKVGLRPLNNVVDVTNYVLMELGHPLHAFDYHKLEENRIVVRRARKDESIVTLDGAERALSEDMLVIADAANPVAVAGVMGGANSEVTEQTTTVLIESAYFDPKSIRRTSKALALSTEASYRFERGADYEMLIMALDRAASLMAELAGGTIARGMIDAYPRKFAPAEIDLRYQRIKRILGIEVAPDAVVSILASLGFEIISKEAETVSVRVPSFRPDVSAEIDLIEEVARIYGYDRIEPTYPQDTAVMSRGIQPRSLEDEVRLIMKGCGFSEIINLSFGAPTDMEDFPETRPGENLKPIRMKNPLTEDASTLRSTLIPGLLKNLRANINTGNKNLKMYEVGKVYWPIDNEILPEEPVFICAAATGLSRPVNWKGKPSETDFFEMKGVAETVLESLCSAKITAARATHSGFHPGMCADLMLDGQSVGKIGEIHPGILEKHEITQKVYVFEINLTELQSWPPARKTYQRLSRFPYSERDLAVVVDEQVEAADLEEAIVRAGGEFLTGVLLFDIYRGKQAGEKKKSLAFSLRFQSSERTLTDDEIAAACKTIMGALEKEFGAKLRT